MSVFFVRLLGAISSFSIMYILGGRLVQRALVFMVLLLVW